MGKLTTKTIKTLPIGKHGDGDGLWLVVTAPERGKWVLRYQVAYKAREMGLGAYPLVGLDKARAEALKARRLVHDGVDPIEAGRKATVKIPTFGELSKSVIEAQTANTAHGYARQWTHSLGTYAASIMAKPVNAISNEDVLGVLAPIWHEKAETARRVRNRIERILDAAKAKGFRTGDNPAALKGNLAHLLGKQSAGVAHHAAMDYTSVAGFVAKLRQRGDTRAMALEFIILSAVRLSEAIDAKWSEVDLEARLWTIPASRMKAGRPHSVPLSARCCQILNAMQVERRSDDRVFHVSIRTIQNLVTGMGGGATSHGFRSSFRDWSGDKTNFPREVCEAALAHAIGNEVERAYRRGSALERRRELMDAWAAYVEGAAGAEVVELNSRRA
jgi:integrase